MNKKGATNMKLVAAVLAVVFLFAGIFIGNSISGFYVYKIETDMANIESLSTDDFTEARVSVEPAIIYLRTRCMRISMVTTMEQTVSIERALKGIEGPRPLAHDLMSNQMEVFGVELLMVKVHTLEDGAYYADIILKQNNIVLEMDSRPSDAIALALRMKAPIYVSDELMEEEGVAVC